MFAGIGLVCSGLSCPITSPELLSLLTNTGNTDLVLQHVLLPQIQYQHYATPGNLCPSIAHYALLVTFNLHWANLTPNYYSFISVPIIPKEIMCRRLPFSPLFLIVNSVVSRHTSSHHHPSYPTGHQTHEHRDPSLNR